MCHTRCDRLFRLTILCLYRNTICFHRLHAYLLLCGPDFFCRRSYLLCRCCFCGFFCLCRFCFFLCRYFRNLFLLCRNLFFHFRIFGFFPGWCLGYFFRRLCLRHGLFCLFRQNCSFCIFHLRCKCFRFQRLCLQSVFLQRFFLRRAFLHDFLILRQFFCCRLRRKHGECKEKCHRQAQYSFFHLTTPFLMSILQVRL